MLLQRRNSLPLTVPGEPRKVKVEAVNSTAVSVQWRPPQDKEHNGIIRGYQIHYVQVNEADEPQAVPIMFDLADGSKSEAIVANLLPDTSYQFQVAAYTRKGDGERSKPKKVKTKGAGLSQWSGFEFKRKLVSLFQEFTYKIFCKITTRIFIVCIALSAKMLE